MTKGLMEGKRGLIMGVANNMSIAWAIARSVHAHGGQMAFTYQGEVLEKRVRPLAQSIGVDFLLPCDVTDEASMENTFKQIEKEWGELDFVVHAIAFSDKNELNGKYVNTTRDNFLKTMDVSCFSFTQTAKLAAPLMKKGGSLVTLSYYGAEKVIPHYNVMGVAKAALEASVRYLAVDLGEENIRVNAISAGPIKTLAASGVGGIRYTLKWMQYNAPMRRNVTVEEVGDSGLYFLSDLSSGVTGEVHYVDCGYNVIGMKNPNALDIVLHSEDAS